MSLKHLFRFKTLPTLFLSPVLSASSVRQISATSLILSNSSTTNKNQNQPLFANNSTSSASENATAEQKNQYEVSSNETLDSLTERFDQILEDPSLSLNDTDVQYSSGVLTVKLGGDLGTYVMNKQTPNLQIWLSSPKSGPKRFDFMDRTWIYKRTGESLHELLTREITECLRKPTDFTRCAFGTRK